MIFLAVKDFSVLALIALIVLQGERIERLLEPPRLEKGDEAGDGAEFLLCARKGGKRVADEGLVLRRYLDPLFAQIVGQPFLRPLAFALIIDVGERLKGEFFGISADVVELPADAHGEDFGACAFVKDDDAGVAVFPECTLNAVEMDGFARTGRSDHEGMPEVANVEIQAIWG